MKHLYTKALAALTLTLSCSMAQADGRSSFTDYARVVHVEPVYRYVTIKEPQRVCTPIQRHRPNHSNSRSQHRTHQRNHQSPGAVFVGGVIGGAIGHELSRSFNGHSSAGATIAGAVIGSAIAGAGTRDANRNRQYKPRNNHQQIDRRHNGNQRNHGNNNRLHHGPTQRCSTTTHTRREQRSDGFDVTYAYHGHKFQTHTKHHPGRRIAIRINLTPQ